MLEWVSWFVIGLGCYFANIFIVSDFCNKRNDRKIINIIILGIFVSLINLYFIINLNSGMKMAVNVIFNVIAFKFLFNDNNSKIIITTLFLYIGYAICEIAFTLIFVFIFHTNLTFWTESVVGIVIANFIIIALTMALFKIKTVKKVVQNIIAWYLSKKILNDILVCILVMSILLFFIYQNYNGLVYRSNFLSIIIFFFGTVIFITGYFKERTNNNKLVFEYDNLINYVKIYEELLDAKNKNQHEYMNQLILIKGMLNKNDKEAIEYIDKALDIEENSQENIWINKFKNIPNGGLKGLLYYKISDIMKNKVNVYIEISDNVNNKNLNKYLNANLEDISKIIGVYLDNAKDAVMESDKKYLIIEMNCDKENLDISISNTFKGNININKLDDVGYSKKGKGHGYGLSLVKDIINKHNDIIQSREINGMYYVQNVSFKYKNK